jgi:predicted nucleotide-binding protein
MAVLIVEDDKFYARQLTELLADHRIEALQTSTAEECLKVPGAQYEAAIIDVMLPNDPDSSGISLEESRAGFLTGVALARRLLKEKPGLKIVLITGDLWGSGDSEQWAKSQGIPIVLKSDGRKTLCRALQDVGILEETLGPRAFIVHGHDEEALLQLKNYLQNTMGWPEPVVLREQPNCGRTIIEKFEDHSEGVDFVFVLLTPDDTMASTSAKEPRRSRQNVIFEFGFFFAQLGRLSGRVIALYKGPNELPSDIQGVAWIAIENGIDAAGEEIRREVAQWERKRS